VNTNLEILEAEVLQLAPVERSHLLERLIASLDSDPKVEADWGHEADTSQFIVGLVRGSFPWADETCPRYARIAKNQSSLALLIF